jgi:hypothetical protein
LRVHQYDTETVVTIPLDFFDYEYATSDVYLDGCSSYGVCSNPRQWVFSRIGDLVYVDRFETVGCAGWDCGCNFVLRRV